MDNNAFNYVVKDITHGRGYVYSLQYHMVLCTKYRKHIFVDNIADEVKEHLCQTAEDLEIKIDAIEIMPDHVHMLIDCKPQCRLSDAVKVFKGNTARWLFMAHPELKKQLWGGHLWNPSYFVVTVSERSNEQVRRYILEQKVK